MTTAAISEMKLDVEEPSELSWLYQQRQQQQQHANSSSRIPHAREMDVLYRQASAEAKKQSPSSSTIEEQGPEGLPWSSESQM